MALKFRGLGTRIANLFNNNRDFQNAFNQAFYKFIGSGFTAYDQDGKEYIDKGFNINPIVYSVISQMATKTMSIPFCIKKVEDEQAKKELKNFQFFDYEKTPALYFQKMKMEDRAYEETEMPMPLERPNPYQNWNELWAISKVFLRTTGNIYYYMVTPEHGQNKGKPLQVYCLPSHLMNIVLKDNANLLLDEDPVSEYRLIEGNMMASFMAEDVIHVKLPNPNFGESGEHLYGQSPLRASLKNIQSSNVGLDQNIKMMKNSGSYGLLSGKGIPLTQAQADQLKQRLIEMENDQGALSNYAGISAEVAFTRLSLTTDELRPFDYLNYDQKQICNVLGWSDKLLNNDAGAKYDNVSQFRKQVVTDNIIPDCTLISEAFVEFLSRFDKYKNTELVFKANQLPEMQQDTEKLAQWMQNLLDRGVISRNEMRTALQFTELDDPEMEVHTVGMNIIPIEMALQAPEPEPENGDDELDTDVEGDGVGKQKAGFDPNQPRRNDGQWSNTEVGPQSKKCFNKWFKDSKMVDQDGDPKEFYHGTTHEFDEFSEERGNIENDFGVGFYFSSSLDDVDQNYDNIGPDLTQRIELRAERIQERDESIGRSQAMTQATNELAGGESRVIPVYLSLKNPLILGGDNETYFEYNWDEEDGSETGNAIELADAIRRVSYNFLDVGDVQSITNNMFTAVMDSGRASDVFQAIRKSEAMLYVTDNVGNLAGHEMLRQIAEEAGFDGIWDKTVHNKFGRGRPMGMPMEGIYEDTEHVIAFEPGQIKSTTAESYCHDTNIHKSMTIAEIKAGFDPNQPRAEDGQWSEMDLRSFENSIANNDYETAGVYDKDGKLIFQKKGTKNQVAFTDEEMELIKSKGAIFTHNHPSGRGFSGADIGMLIKLEMNEMRAIGPYGVFSMKLKKVTDARAMFKTFQIEYKLARRHASKVTDKWFYSNDTNSDAIIRQANEKIVTETWDYFSKQYFGKEYMDYTFIPTKYL